MKNFTSYFMLLISYIVSLYELWQWGEKGETNDKNSNIKTTFILLIPHFIAILEINRINIAFLLLTKKQQLVIKQNEIITNCEDIHATLSSSIVEGDANCGKIANLIGLMAKVINKYLEIAKKKNASGYSGQKKSFGTKRRYNNRRKKH